jgi:hypothetical protein
MEGPRAAGYLLYKPSENLIHEIGLEDNSRMLEVMGLFLQTQGCGGVTVRVRPYETETIAAFSAFAETYSIHPAYSFAVFDYKRFVPPFLKLKSSLKTLPGGTYTLQIEGGPKLTLAVINGKASLSETGEPAALSLSPIEALRFLFSADYAAGSPAVAGNPFLQCLLPLPLSMETADEV